MKTKNNKLSIKCISNTLEVMCFELVVSKYSGGFYNICVINFIYIKILKIIIYWVMQEMYVVNVLKNCYILSLVKTSRTYNV